MRRPWLLVRLLSQHLLAASRNLCRMPGQLNAKQSLRKSVVDQKRSRQCPRSYSRQCKGVYTTPRPHASSSRCGEVPKESVTITTVDSAFDDCEFLEATTKNKCQPPDLLKLQVSESAGSIQDHRQSQLVGDARPLLFLEPECYTIANLNFITRICFRNVQGFSMLDDAEGSRPFDFPPRQRIRSRRPFDGNSTYDIDKPGARVLTSSSYSM